MDLRKIVGHRTLLMPCAGAIAGIVINAIFYTEINGKSIAGYIEDGIE